MQTLDIADIARRIDSPYHLVPLAETAGVEIKVAICSGPKAWHRSGAHDELALVLEGNVIVEGPTGRVVVDEGDMVRLPARIGHGLSSGMRSTLLLFRQKELPEDVNGHRPAAALSEEALGEEALESPTRINFGAGVRREPAFEWLAIGQVGTSRSYSTRLRGTSAPYDTEDGELVVIVFRGVVEARLDAPASGDAASDAADDPADTEGPGDLAEPGSQPHAAEEHGPGEAPGSARSFTVVGSQMLVLPRGVRVTLSSDRGATVVVLANAKAPLPQAAPG